MLRVGDSVLALSVPASATPPRWQLREPRERRRLAALKRRRPKSHRVPHPGLRRAFPRNACSPGLRRQRSFSCQIRRGRRAEAGWSCRRAPKEILIVQSIPTDPIRARGRYDEPVNDTHPAAEAVQSSGTSRHSCRASPATTTWTPTCRDAIVRRASFNLVHLETMTKVDVFVRRDGVSSGSRAPRSIGTTWEAGQGSSASRISSNEPSPRPVRDRLV